MSFVGQIEAAELPRISVFGIGGGGGNGVAGLAGRMLPNVDLVAANTDAQALRGLVVDRQLQLGRMATRGLGAGAWPEIGRAAAQEMATEIDAALDGVDFCFITAGMGGGTGTGAAPVFAEMARRRGIPTIAVVTRPFEFEGARRAARADQGIEQLEPWVDALIVVPNQRLLGIDDIDLTFRDAMDASNEVLADAVGSIADLLVTPAIKQIGFAELTNVISGMGRAVIGFGEARGRGRAELATERALACPLIDDEVAGARKLMISISGGADLSLHELDAVIAMIVERASPEVELAWGASICDELDGAIRVALVAQGRPALRLKPMEPVIADVPDRVAARWIPAPGATGFLAAETADVKPEAATRPRPEPEVALLETVRAAPFVTASLESLETVRAAAPAATLRDPEPVAVDIGDAPPLLALLASLPPEPAPAILGTDTVVVDPDAPAIPLHISACTMDELWLGDFEMEDPRRQSLGDRVGALVTGLWRAMLGRFGIGRPARIAYSTGRMAGAAV